MTERPPFAPRPLADAALALVLTTTGLTALALPALAQAQAAPGVTATARRSAPMPPSAPVTLNFVNADIEAVTRAIGAMTGRQLIVDPRVKGTITVYAEQPVPVREAYFSYLAALRGLGYAVVESAGLYKVVPEAEAKLQAGTVSVGPPEQRGDLVITQVFRLNHENPNNLVAILRPLITPNNTINASPGSNTLVITDYADNLARIGKIIAALDQPAVTDIEIVPLQHAVASDIAALVQKLGDGAVGAVLPGAAQGGGSPTVLADPRTNSLIIRGANAAKLVAMRALIDKLDKPSAGGATGGIHVVYLKNADATKLATVLRAAFGGGSGGGSGGSTPAASFAPPMAATGNVTAGGAGATVATTPVATSAQPSTGGFIQADPATNSLIITAAEPLYRQIRAVIDQLDGRRAQVFVESMIVEMDASKAAEFGFQWQSLLWGKVGDRNGVVGGTNFGSGSTNIINLSGVGSSSSVSASAEVNGLNLALLHKINGVYTLGALARFLETVSGTNILSTPNLVALDNEEAKIVVGSNVPFVTGSFTNTGSTTTTVNPFQTIERKDVGLTLKIKPQIGEGGVVRMTVFQENSSVVASTSSNSNGPTTNKSSVETTVVADDGQIMVLGGQTKEQYDGAQDKVPGLGDVPLFGNLFKSESRKRQRSVLLVFLRPVVLRDAQKAESLTLDRYEAIRAVQQAEQPAPSVVLPIGDSPVLPPAAPASAPAKKP